MTLNREAYSWRHADITAASNLHDVFLGWPSPSKKQHRRFRDAPVKVRRAARTIAELTHGGPITPPKRTGSPKHLPLPDAVLVQSSLEDWAALSPEAAEERVRTHLQRLTAVYGPAVDAWQQMLYEPVTVHVVGSSVLTPSAAERVRRRLWARRADAGTETDLDRGLLLALVAHKLETAGAPNGMTGQPCVLQAS